MEELLEIVRARKYTAATLRSEADCVEDCGEWMRMPLVGFSAEELRSAAKIIEQKGSKA